MPRDLAFSHTEASASRDWPFGAPDPATVASHGYVMDEYIVSGQATRYRAKPNTTPGIDGHWDTEPSDVAPFVTRVYVVRPDDASSFNGVLLAHWQNVTMGYDFGMPHGDEVFRGYAWAGITAQDIGVHGEPGRTFGLPEWNPVRYGSLSHPGDAYSYDIFSQIARALRDGPSTDQPDPLGGLRPSILIAEGASQSAMRLGSYVNVAHRRDRLFDGFFLNAHWGMCPPLEETTLLEQFAPGPNGLHSAASQVDDRGGVPILVLASESEAPSNFPVRQPDTNRWRFWEVAGGTHAGIAESDRIHQVSTRDGWDSPGTPPPNPNVVDYEYVKDAAVRWLVRWIRDDEQPPRFPPIDIEQEPSGALAFVRDDTGNVTGGLRVPELGAATGIHRGTNDGGMMGQLRGESLLFDQVRLIEVHGDRTEFLAAWDAAVSQLQRADILLPAEADAVRDRGRGIWPAP